MVLTLNKDLNDTADCRRHAIEGHTLVSVAASPRDVVDDQDLAAQTYLWKPSRKCVLSGVTLLEAALTLVSRPIPASPLTYRFKHIQPQTHTSIKTHSFLNNVATESGLRLTVCYSKTCVLVYWC